MAAIVGRRGKTIREEGLSIIIIIIVSRKKEIIYMRETRVDAERKRERKEERRHRTYHRRTKYHAKHTNRKEREKKREIQRGRAALIAERESEHTKI